MRRLRYAGLIGVLTGCYVYAPSETPVPEVGKEVRASLVNPRDMSSGGLIIREVNQVDGTLFETAADTLVIWSKWLHGGRAGRYFANGEVFPFVLGELESLEVRTLDPLRTVVVSVVALGVGAGLFAFTSDLGGGGGGEPGPGDRQGQIVPVIPFTGLPNIP